MAMRIGVGQAARATDEYLAFASQLGVSGVQLNTPDLPGERRWEVGDLIALREKVEGYGLELEAIENVPNAFYEDAMLGRPGRDEDIENVAATIRNMGTAGIPVLGFNWMPTSVWRTDLSPVGRGGAVVSGFDLAIAEDDGQADKVLVARRDRRVEDQKDSWSRGPCSISPAPEVMQTCGARMSTLSVPLCRWRKKPASAWPCTRTTLPLLPWAMSPGSSGL